MSEKLTFKTEKVSRPPNATKTRNSEYDNIILEAVKANAGNKEETYFKSEVNRNTYQTANILRKRITALKIPNVDIKVINKILYVIINPKTTTPKKAPTKKAQPDK